MQAVQAQSDEGRMAVEGRLTIKPVNWGEDIGGTEVPKESCFADQVLPRITSLLFVYTDELLMHQHPRKQWDGHNTSQFLLCCKFSVSCVVMRCYFASVSLQQVLDSSHQLQGCVQEASDHTFQCLEAWQLGS